MSRRGNGNSEVAEKVTSSIVVPSMNVSISILIPVAKAYVNRQHLLHQFLQRLKYSRKL